MNSRQYFNKLQKDVREEYKIAEKAREKGLDPDLKVEIPLTETLAEKVVGLISIVYPQIEDERIVKRILELEKEYGLLDFCVSLKIAEEIAKEKFCKFKTQEEAIDAGIRVGFAYITVGVVTSPLEGYTHWEKKKRKDGKDYMCLYYSGPVRSAGGTNGTFSILIADHIRESMGYFKYDPTEDEVKRTITEILDYHERITNLQYVPSAKEIEFIARNLPVQINGLPSEDKEVYNYKDLPRIETNFIRNGVALILGEGLAQKAHKILKILTNLRKKGFELRDWDWLKDFVDLKNKEQQNKKVSESSATYISDIVAGRPVLGHPGRAGGFRLRYGKCRTAGLSSMAMNPLSMSVLRNYVAVGTQLKYEGPGKSSAMSLCDDIDGPIIKLNNESVVKIDTKEKANKYIKDMKEILFLGDFLVNYGEFFNRGKHFEKPGYVEEWYSAELEEKIKGKDMGSLKKIVEEIIKDWRTKIEFDEAVEISRKFNIPLHPNFIYYWKELDYVFFLGLLDWVAHGKVTDGKLILPFEIKGKERFVKGKRALELLGVEHEATLENVVIGKKSAKSFLFNFGIHLENFEEDKETVSLKVKKIGEKNVLELINELCEIKIKDKAGTYIGNRMGRPEKAKLRKLTGSPHVLFPVGEEGGRLRSFQSALEKGYVTAEFPNFYCEFCEKESVYFKCKDCGKDCQRKVSEKSFNSFEKKIDVRTYFDHAKKVAGVNLDEVDIVKGVRGTSNKDHSCEHLAKGFLRAKYGLNVNKDGTIRYDMTEMPLTHFKPLEIGTSIEKLKELGYEKDYLGNKIEREDQLLEIFPQDIILPACPDSMDEKADDVFIKVSKYIDDLLERLYGLEKYYNIKKREDLAGHFVLGLAPHTSAAIIGRIIGFTKTQACIAHPMWHAAQRRDCFSYDTNLPIYDGKSWNNVKIGEFVEGLKPDKKVDSYGTLAKDVNDYKTLAYNTKTKKMDVMPIKWFTKHTPTDMLSIELENGRELKVTTSHKFFVANEGGLEEKRAFDLAKRDKLIVPYNYDVKENNLDLISLEEYFKNKEYVMMEHVKNYVKEKMKGLSFSKFCELFNLKGKGIYNYLKRDSFPIKLIDSLLKHYGEDWDDLPSGRKLHVKRNFVEFPVKVKVDNELMKIIGFYIAEGFSRKKLGEKGYYQVDFAVYEDDLRKDVEKMIIDKFGLKPSKVGGQKRLTYSSRLFYEFFVNILKTGKGAHFKRIPHMFLNLPKEKLASLLSAYFECDGSVSVKDLRVSCDSVSQGLIYDIEFVLARFGIYVRKYASERTPGRKVREFYIRKEREIPKFKSTKLIIPSNFSKNFYDKINFISERKRDILRSLLERVKPRGMKVEYDDDYAYLKIKNIKKLIGENTYCLNVPGHHNVIANGVIAKQCEGDETSVILFLDALINFSKHFLPAHRGGTQDAPLVASSVLSASEIDDMAFDIDVVWKYPLELYEAAEQEKNPWDIKIEQLKSRLGTDKAYYDFGFTHTVKDINDAVLCSAYKLLPTMGEKVEGQMKIAEILRSVDVKDVARLVIERHFIRDIRGNLRKFSQQGFRCVTCNSKYRRPPIVGKCTKCGGRIIFTISEGSILKYMQPALDLAEKYNVSAYLKESLELTEMYIQSIFGKEKEKQEAIDKWF